MFFLKENQFSEKITVCFLVSYKVQCSISNTVPLEAFGKLSSCRCLPFYDRSSLQSDVPSPPTERAPMHLEDTEYSFKG